MAPGYCMAQGHRTPRRRIRVAARTGHLGHAAGVAATGEGRVEKGQKAVARHLQPDQAGAEREHVGVVVLARKRAVVTS